MNCDWLSDSLDWWTTQRASAAAAVVAAGAAVTAATSGIRTLRQNRRDSSARSRPMVAAELREVPYVKGTQIMVVRNYGPSIARNVRVLFDPEIPDPTGSGWFSTTFLKRRYAKAIPALTPGMELDNIYYSGVPSGDSWENREPTPQQVNVRITYENDAGHEFTDVFPLDTDLLRTRTYTESSGSPDEQVKVVAKSLKTLADLASKADRRAGAQESNH